MTELEVIALVLRKNDIMQTIVKVVTALDAGEPPATISRRLNIPRSQVYKIKDKYLGEPKSA